MNYKTKVILNFFRLCLCTDLCPKRPSNTPCNNSKDNASGIMKSKSNDPFPNPIGISKVYFIFSSYLHQGGLSEVACVTSETTDGYRKIVFLII